MRVTDTLIGMVFDGRYRIVRKLGMGGMANVYLAEDQELGRRVAIKILNDRHAADDQFVERFRREAKNAASLSHPNIVSIYDRGEAEGTYYIAMEYLEGRTLKELIVARGPVPPGLSIAYARQVLRAIGFAHKRGIVHRDIKPHNVLIDVEGRLKVTDFGIARSGASQMTEAGSIIGTAQYLSPEQARGASVDQRSDLYSLGVVLYEMLTGTVPFAGDTPVEIAMKHLSSVPVPPSERRDGIPPGLDQIVLRALAKDPDDRYASADEMDADLGRVARGLAVSEETADAATAVLDGAGIAALNLELRAPTTVIRSRAATAPARRQAPYIPPVRYEYEAPPRRRRPFWPWVLALLLLVGAGFGGYFAWGELEDRFAATASATVPFVEGSGERRARTLIGAEGLDVRAVREPDEDAPVGQVFRQEPEAGLRIDKEAGRVTIHVSSGKPQTVVPNVEGLSLTEATAAIANAGLTVRAVNVNSNVDEGRVTAQSLAPGDAVARGDRIRINISLGPKRIEVPVVLGDPVANATSKLQGRNFAVGRSRLVFSDRYPAGTVVRQFPRGNSFAPVGTRARFVVSKGPRLFVLPNVTGQVRDTAVTTLEDSGFTVEIRRDIVRDRSRGGLVLDQSPPAGERVRRGTPVTITVGRWVRRTEPAPDPAPDEPTFTEPLPDDPALSVPTPTPAPPLETTPAEPPPSVGGGDMPAEPVPAEPPPSTSGPNGR